MSDSFADLWSASAPSKPKDQPLSAALSSSSATITPYASSKPDVFALLSGSSSISRPGTSAPRYRTNLSGVGLGGSHSDSRSIAVGLSNLSSISSTPNNTERRTLSQPQPPLISKTGTADAFGDLFPLPSTASGSTNMILATRLAMEAQRKEKTHPRQGSGSIISNLPAEGGSVWAGLDVLADGLTAMPMIGESGRQESKAQPTVVDNVDDWGLSDFGASAPVQSVTGMNGDANGANTARPKPSSGGDLRDLDGTTSSTTPISGSHSGPGTSSTLSQPVLQTARHNSHAAHKGQAKLLDEKFDFRGLEDQVDGARPKHQAESAGPRQLLELFDDNHDATRGPEPARGLLDSEGHGDAEEDVLGLLSKPIDSVRTHHMPLPEPTSRHPSPTIPNIPNPPSPPPHIISQIVEMGFSIEQARVALAHTFTGLDVPAAVESLLNGLSPPPSKKHFSSTPPPYVQAAPKGRKEREREWIERQLEREWLGRRQGAAAGAASVAGEDAMSTPRIADIQEQADKLLTQASEIGFNVFSRATAMWDKGKERMVNAYEEHTGVLPPVGNFAESRESGHGKGGSGGVIGGRPKWMQGVVGEESRQSVFRDDNIAFEIHDEGESSGINQTRSTQVAQPSPPEDEIDLFSEAPTAPRTQSFTSTTASVVLPSKHTAPLQPTSGCQQSTISPPSHPAPAPAPSPTTPPPTERTLPSASPSALASALKHKTAGTAQFKLGQYAAAADAYGAGIQALPRGHLLRVPLYTNRALARIRCGEYKAAEEDCTRALGIVLDDDAVDVEDEFAVESKTVKAVTGKEKSLVWSPSALPSSLLPTATWTTQTAWTHPEGCGVDLADGYVKALRRRAEALEGREKWSAAASDWEVLAGCAWTSESVRKDAVRGRRRCKEMMSEPNGSTTTTSNNRQKPTSPVAKPPTGSKSASTAVAAAPAPSQALLALQSQNAQAEADDALKASLKDVVDARLAGWCRGREGNIRALLVGLDAVLWDSILEGVRLRGLHELVSPAQVKKGYVRVIARVHPDKLNSTNSTVEQRMLANGVFGTLNKAWIAFQITQK